MTIQLLRQRQKKGQLETVRFIQNACAPIVIQVVFSENGQWQQQLIKNRHGQVMTCTNLAQAYAICRSAGVYRAALVQIVAHDEACAADSAVTPRPSISLTFQE